jgi:hypothetical protein
MMPEQVFEWVVTESGCYHRLAARAVGRCLEHRKEYDSKVSHSITDNDGTACPATAYA